jgi:hypothetical protein
VWIFDSSLSSKAKCLPRMPSLEQVFTLHSDPHEANLLLHSLVRLSLKAAVGGDGVSLFHLNKTQLSSFHNYFYIYTPLKRDFQLLSLITEASFLAPSG